MISEKITVLSPRGTAPPIQLVPMAPRLDTLEGRTIYIVDVNFPRTHQFFEEMQRLLSNKYPGTTWILRTKTGTYFHNAPRLWDEIKEKGDGVMMGIGQQIVVVGGGPMHFGWLETSIAWRQHQWICGDKATFPTQISGTRKQERNCLHIHGPQKTAFVPAFDP
jgi:hypothetical protein